jgi:hypothetical protein
MKEKEIIKERKKGNKESKKMNERKRERKNKNKEEIPLHGSGSGLWFLVLCLRTAVYIVDSSTTARNLTARTISYAVQEVSKDCR